jgi:hypothetical protein
LSCSNSVPILTIFLNSGTIYGSSRTIIYIENINAGASGTQQNADMGTHVAHVSTQGVMGGSLSGYFVWVDDGAARTVNGTAVQEDGQDWYTIGARQKGKLGGLDYRVEYYHQFGDGAVAANDLRLAAGTYTGLIDSADIDRDASLFGIRVGKTFKNAQYSPTITLWYDRLTGNDDDNITNAEYGGFDTLFDTGHKFYGFMDQ